LALHYPKIRRLLDLSVFLDAPFYVQSGRRLHDKTPEDFPLGYDKLVLRPMHDRYVSPSKIHASVTLNVANMSQQQVLDKVTALIVPHLT
jgi:uridine kinase